MDWIEANGVSHRYELAGRGDRVVVLVHEMGGMLESWDEVMPGFQKDFRTLRYDQRGFGMTEKPVGKVTIDDLVADLAALLDALHVSAPCHLVSSALGTAVLIAFAARHPARVARMVLASAVTGTRAESRDMHLQRSEVITRGGLRASMERSLDRSYPERFRGDRERFERFRRRWLTTAPASYVAMADMVVGLDLFPKLSKIVCPTLIVGSLHDPQRPPALMKDIAGAIRGARYAEIDSGHFAAVETPGLFLETVVPFLRGE